MTASFAQELNRRGFGSPLHISDSLQAIQHEPLSALFGNRNIPIVVSDPSTLGECVLRDGSYSLPSIDSVLDLIDTLDERTAGEIEWSRTFGELEAAWEPGASPEEYSGEDNEEFGPIAPLAPEDFPKLRAEELAMLSLYADEALVNSDMLQGVADIEGLSFAFGHQPWFNRINPLILARLAPLLSDGFAPTIGEVAHTISRFPNAFQMLDQELYETLFESLPEGRNVLQPLVGESWLSHLTFALHYEQNCYPDTSTLIATALSFALTGKAVEELQRYDNHLDGSESLIFEAISAGIDADMLPDVAA